MKVDIRTVVIILGFTNLLLVFAFLLQYFASKTYRGIGLWAFGYGSVALGFVSLILRDFVPITLISIILPNVLLVIGVIFIYLGIRRFLGKKGYEGVLLSIFVVFLLSLSYYTFIHDDITARTVIVTAVSAVISLMIAHSLFRNKSGSLRFSVYFTFSVFFLFGCFSAFRALVTLTIPPISSIFTPSPMQTWGVLIPLVLSVLGTFGLIVMVNEQLNGEMKQAKEQFEVIFDASPDASVISRLNDGVIVNVNERFLELSGFSRNECVGKPTRDLDLWANPSDRKKAVDELREKKHYLNYEAVFQGKAGDQITGIMSAKVINLGDIPHVLGVTRDITERKRVEEALRESEEKYRHLYDEAPVGYMELDSEGRVDRVNRRMSEMLGYSPNEMIGKHVWTFVVEEREAEEIVKAKLSGYVHPSDALERTYKRKDAPPIPVLIKDRVARDSEGRITRIRVTVQDITERKQMEEKLRKSRDELELRVKDRTAELESKNRELQEFAFIASHDLNEPLRKIQTFGDLLKEKSAERLTEKEKDYVLRMTRAADRMQDLLEGLLRYSRVETKGLQFRPVRLTDIVKDAAGDLEIALRNAGVQLEIGPLPIISGDPHQWRQVFQNLIGNAAKYHRSEVQPLIRIYGEEDNGAHSFFIADNGIGFDEKYLDKIFQPFQRLHGKHEYPGTGIGLAICKKIVERHGGTITAKSTPGKGSTFVIRLPAAQEQS